MLGNQLTAHREIIDEAIQMSMNLASASRDDYMKASFSASATGTQTGSGQDRNVLS